MSLKVLLAFIVVMLIWSTTPLTIKWSSDGPSFIFGVTARMVLGAVLMLMIARVKRIPIPLHGQAIRTYIAAGIGIYGAMLSVYWGAQYIQSGFISVIFGLSPIVTGVLAYFILQERGLTGMKLLGIFVAMVGLLIVFWNSISFGQAVVLGMAAVCLAMLLHSISAVLVKRWHGDLSSLSVATGGMMVATPTYVVTWLIMDGNWPAQIPSHAFWSIIYLGVIATAIGFNIYFYILKQMPASQVALLTLVTPVLALWFGQLFNHEVIDWHAWVGSLCILFGMGLYQWGTTRLQRLKLKV